MTLSTYLQGKLNRMNPTAEMTKLGDVIVALQGSALVGLVAQAGANITMKLGDAIGVNKLSITDSANAEQAQINSDGVATFTKTISPIVSGVTDLNLLDTSALKIRGLISTRSAADDSMYIPVANAAAGTERGMKVCYSPAANGGGYFESQYVNTKVNASMAGTVRASEHKVSVTGTANASGEVAALLAKLDVEAGATVASGIGLDVLVDNETSGTVTKAVGLRVQSGGALNSEVIHNAIDVSGNYKNGAIKMPFATASTSGAPNLAALVSAFGTAANKGPSTTAVMVGFFKDSAGSGHLWKVNAFNGAYYIIDCGAAVSA